MINFKGMTILKALLNKLSKIKPFSDNFSEVKESLKHSIAVCLCMFLYPHAWISKCATRHDAR